ncbi:MAG: signal peptidase I [Acidimicrobiia bacterium]
MTDDLDASSPSSPVSAPVASPVSADPADTPPTGSSDEAAPPAGTKASKGINRTVVEWIVLIVAAIVIAIVIKSFLFQAFYIPSASMDPTLKVGDRVLVNKLSYDLHDINRGDIVVFASAPNKEWNEAGIDDLVKRVIALPGETITECGDSRICIDGHVLDEKYLPSNVVPALPWPSTTPPGCEPDSPPHGCTVPAGHYFVMGDNRDNSSDARAHGPIKGSSIVGRVFVRIWPLDRLGFL